MGNVSLMMNQIIMMLIIACAGLFLRKIGVFTDAVIKGINKTLLTIATPAMILMVTQKDYRPDMMKGFAQVILVGLAAMTICIGIMIIAYAKGDRSRYKPVAAMLSAMPNAGYMGLPIIQAVYGDEGTLFVAAYIVAFNVVSWTVCTALFTGFSVKSLKGMINPGFCATIIGTIFYVAQIRLPAPLLSTVNQLGDINTPLSLLLLGARMETLRPKQLLNIHLAIPCAVKLLVLPAVTLVVCRLIGMAELPLGVAVISTAMPAAAFCQMFAERYDREIAYASTGVSISTILSLATLPLVMLMIG